MNIVLIGMPGSGKSTLGVLLAKRLCLNFVDTDLLIQTAGGQPLQNIIGQAGVDGFLEFENDLLVSLQCDNTVIATGGSAVLSPQAMQHLQKNAVTVYLRISLATMKTRIDNAQTRGIALRPDEDLPDMYKSRAPLYEKYADIVINCGRTPPEGCLRKMIGQVAAYGKSV